MLLEAREYVHWSSVKSGLYPAATLPHVQIIWECICMMQMQMQTWALLQSEGTPSAIKAIDFCAAAGVAVRRSCLALARGQGLPRLLVQEVNILADEGKGCVICRVNSIQAFSCAAITHLWRLHTNLHWLTSQPGLWDVLANKQVIWQMSAYEWDTRQVLQHQGVSLCSPPPSMYGASWPSATSSQNPARSVPS